MKQPTNLIILLLLVILLFSNLKTCQTVNNVRQEYGAALDSITQVPVINVAGDTTYRAETKVIQASIKDLRKLTKQLQQSNNDALSKLNKLVNKNTQSATYYNSTTNITNTTDTILEVINKVDTFYETRMTNPWYNAHIILGADTARLSLSVINPFNVSHEYVRKGLKKDLLVKVLPLNPYTKVTELKSFTIPKKKHHFRFGPEIGIYNNNISAGLFTEYQFKDFGFIGTAGYSLNGLYYGGKLRYYFLQF